MSRSEADDDASAESTLPVSGETAVVGEVLLGPDAAPFEDGSASCCAWHQDIVRQKANTSRIVPYVSLADANLVCRQSLLAEEIMRPPPHTFSQR